jgi:hypothetical protein
MTEESFSSALTNNSFNKNDMPPIDFNNIFGSDIKRNISPTSVFENVVDRERQEEETFNIWARHWAAEEKYQQEIKTIINKFEDLMEQQMEICNLIMKSMTEYKRKLR